MTVESPFLPDGRQWAWNSSTLGPAKECARKYYYKVKRGLTPKSHSVHLKFGGHYAVALETYHRYRADTDAGHYAAVAQVVLNTLVDTWEYEFDDAGHPVAGAGRPWQSNDLHKNRENLIRSIVWYLDEFENDPCRTVQLPSGPAVELSFRFQLDDDIWVTGHIDRLVSYAGENYVQDQKTTGSSLGSHYFKRYNPDNQMSLYTIAAKVAWNTPVRGVMIDAAQIGVGFTRFERGFSFRTPDQTTEWLDGALYHIRNIWRAEEAGWPMNDTACSKFGGCEFREVCSKAPGVREAFLATGFTVAFRNPLEA